jgi:hypothetical protein
VNSFDTSLSSKPFVTWKVNHRGVLTITLAQSARSDYLVQGRRASLFDCPHRAASLHRHSYCNWRTAPQEKADRRDQAS